MANRLMVMVLLVITLHSCEKQEMTDELNTGTEVLSDFSHVQTVKPSTIRTLVSLAGYPQFKNYFKYQSAIYRITYRTNYNDSSIIASGLLCLPINMPQPWPVLNIFHGLIFADHEAPSSFSLPNNFIGYEFISSIGFAVFIPDLIGFGTTRDITFGIYNKALISKVSVDMIAASTEFLDERNMSYSNLYFGGYSLGGYDALATLQYINEQDIDLGLPIGGAVIGAGGYNLYNVMKTNIAKEKYPSPAQLILLISSYNELNGWNQPLNFYFRDDVAVKIPYLLSGAFTSDEINQQLPDSYDSLFNPDYLYKLRNDKDTIMVNTLAENSVHTWIPNCPMRLYHSRDDEKIPYSDSEQYYQYISPKSTNGVALVDISGSNHFDSAPAYIEQALLWLLELVRTE